MRKRFSGPTFGAYIRRQTDMLKLNDFEVSYTLEITIVTLTNRKPFSKSMLNDNVSNKTNGEVDIAENGAFLK